MPCLVNQTRTVWSRAQESNSNDVMTRPPPTTCPASSTGVSAAESSLDPYPRAANVSSSKKDVQEVQAQCDEHRMCTALRLYHELLCAANIRCRRNILLSQCCNGLTLAHSCMPHTNKQFACYQALRPTCSCFCTPSCQLRETRSIFAGHAWLSSNRQAELQQSVQACTEEDHLCFEGQEEGEIPLPDTPPCTKPALGTWLAAALLTKR